MFILQVPLTSSFHKMATKDHCRENSLYTLTFSKLKMPMFRFLHKGSHLPKRVPYFWRLYKIGQDGSKQTLKIPSHKYYTSYHLLVDQCHLNIFTLQYMSWSVLCFYVLSAYPCFFNSNHTNKTYVFVVPETGFLNEGNQCFSKFLTLH